MGAVIPPEASHPAGSLAREVGYGPVALTWSQWAAAMQIYLAEEWFDQYQLRARQALRRLAELLPPAGGFSRLTGRSTAVARPLWRTLASQRLRGRSGPARSASPTATGKERSQPNGEPAAAGLDRGVIGLPILTQPEVPQPGVRQTNSGAPVVGAAAVGSAVGVVAHQATAVAEPRAGLLPRPPESRSRSRLEMLAAGWLRWHRRWFMSTVLVCACMVASVATAADLPAVLYRFFCLLYFAPLIIVPLTWFAELTHLIDDNDQWVDWRTEPLLRPVADLAPKRGRPNPDLAAILEGSPIPRRCRIAWVYRDRYPRPTCPQPACRSLG